MRRKTERLLLRVPDISIKERLENEIEEEGDEMSEDEDNEPQKRPSKKVSIIRGSVRKKVQFFPSSLQESIWSLQKVGPFLLRLIVAQGKGHLHVDLVQHQAIIVMRKVCLILVFLRNHTAVKPLRIRREMIM
jgi:hypothetical protein